MKKASKALDGAHDPPRARHPRTRTGEIADRTEPVKETPTGPPQRDGS